MFKAKSLPYKDLVLNSRGCRKSNQLLRHPQAVLQNKTEELISACLIPDIPNLVEERERIIKLAEQCGIGFSASKNSCCKKCGGDTRIRYWKLDGNIFKPS